ncbi:hypothetical protein JN06_00614 [Bacteroides zoogleoformans]|nr:hypothetical protein JN06_00614 [Bacteroides zoogleoformans]
MRVTINKNSLGCFNGKDTAVCNILFKIDNDISAYIKKDSIKIRTASQWYSFLLKNLLFLKYCYIFAHKFIIRTLFSNKHIYDYS